VAWTAIVAEIPSGTPAWDAAVAELKGKRLNAPDGDAMPARWAAQCRLLSLTPTGGLGTPPEGSLATAPVSSPATTRHAVPAALPSLLFRRKRR
jgi:hypothetical protein